MAFFNFTRRTPTSAPDQKALSLTDPGILDLFGAVPTGSGITVSAATAMRVPAVAAAVGLIAETIGTLPVKLHDRQSKATITDHPAARLLHREANPWTSAGQLRTDLALDALTRDGGGFALVTRRTDGRPAELHRLDPSKVTVEIAGDGEPSYIVQHDQRRVRYAYTEIMHVRALGGLCPITLGREAIGLAIAFEQHVGQLFRNGGRPSGIITSPKSLDPEAKRKLAASWFATHAGKAAGGTALLDEGMAYQQLATTLADAQFAENRVEQIREIARAFRIPAPMIGELGRATWSNLEQLNRQFLQSTLAPWLRTFEACYSRVLLTDEERETLRIEFVSDALLESDAAAKATAYGQYRAMGAMSANEVRAGLNLPRHEDGDDLANPYTTSPTPEASE